MKFAILRLQKLKTMAGISGSLRHAYRTQPTPNADPAMASQNGFAGISNYGDAIARYNERLASAGRVRKNAVMAIEHLVTASPEHMASMSREQQNAFFNDALRWIKAKYGGENVVAAGIHRDELTPHMWCHVIPLHQGKLNARHFIGGHKNRLSEMQTDFHETVAAKYGMERGVQGSRSRHTQVRHWYGVIQEVMAHQVPASKTEWARLIMSGRLPSIVQGALALAAQARQTYERASARLKRAESRYAEVMSMSDTQGELETARERLRASEAARAAQASQLDAMREERRENAAFRRTIEPYFDQIRAAMLADHGIQPDDPRLTPVPEPAIQQDPDPIVPPVSASQLTL